MRGDPKVIDALNQLLATELTAVHQYLLHGFMCERWGYARLHHKHHEESREEMEHVDQLVQRILFLEGAPDLQKMDRIVPGANVLEQLRADHALEVGAAKAYNDGIRLARSVGDNGTSELLEHILVATEEHADWLESQLTAIDQIGIERYLAEQLKKYESST